jgi:hypothetical protein
VDDLHLLDDGRLAALARAWRGGQHWGSVLGSQAELD